MDIYRSGNLRSLDQPRLCLRHDHCDFRLLYRHKRLEPQWLRRVFLQSRKIDAIHFISRDNDWYQYAELPEAARAAAEITSAYKRVVAYGSSMGGYAAIRFGGLVGAKTAVALSPQYSIHPKIVPFENRWAGDAARIEFIYDEKPPCAFTETSIVFFDPHDADKQHVELFRGKTKLCEVRTPNGGHPCGSFLAETGLLQDILMQVASGDFDPASIQREIRRRRGIPRNCTSRLPRNRKGWDGVYISQKGPRTCVQTLLAI